MSHDSRLSEAEPDIPAATIRFRFAGSPPRNTDRVWRDDRPALDRASLTVPMRAAFPRRTHGAALEGGASLFQV